MNNSNKHDDAVIVALGSNLAGRHPSSLALLEAALARFPGAGLPVIACSSWWRSAAWPDPTAPDYLNGVVLVETRLSPRVVLTALLTIEADFGRRREAANAPRTLDLDLIAHGRRILHEPGLTIPHPRAWRRRFVMAPLAQIAPAWSHPVTGETAVDLAENADIGEMRPPPMGGDRSP